MQVNVVKMLLWEQNLAMASKAIPDDVVRVVSGETSYLGVDLAEVSHVIMADADFDPSGIDDEVLEKLYCAGKWYDKEMGACPGSVSFRRSILEGRRPYLVVGVRDRTLKHPSGVEMGSGLLRCLDGENDNDGSIGKGGLASLPTIVPRYGLEVSRFPAWFQGHVLTYVSELREDMAANTLTDSNVLIVRSPEGVGFMVFSLTGGNASWCLPLLQERGFTVLRDVSSPTIRHNEVLLELDRMGRCANRYLD